MCMGGGLFLDTQLPTLFGFLFLSQSHAPLLTNTADEPSIPHQISAVSLLSFWISFSLCIYTKYPPVFPKRVLGFYWDCHDSLTG